MCETTLAIEQHPKLMAELLDVVRSCKRIRKEAAELRADARALRLNIRAAEEADDGPALRHVG